MTGVNGRVVGGRYRLVEPVGRGGMGQVWRGHDELLDRRVAVKEVLLPDGLTPEARRELVLRMMREARVAARLQHPGIVTVHDVVDDGDAPWVVMEFVAGRSLGAELAAEGRLPWRRVAGIGADIADALAHAHAEGVVHRDLKPDNVLLAGRRTVLTDFGIARVLDATTKLTRTNAVIGTPQFMAPEQIDGALTTPAGDMWSLGTTLYAALEGAPPFDAPSLFALFHAIMSAPLPPTPHAGPLADLLAGLLAKAPADRPDAVTTAEALRDALRGPAPEQPAAPTVVVAPVPVPTVREPAPAPAPVPVPEPATGPALTPVPTVAEPEPEPVPVPTAVVPVPTVAEPDPEPDREPVPEPGPAGAGGSAAAVDPAAETVLATAPPDPPGKKKRRLSRRTMLLGGVGVLAAAGGAAYGIEAALGGGGGTPTNARTVAFSPDGKLLASGHLSGKVYVWDAAELKVKASFDPQGYSPVAQVLFSPDGSTLWVSTDGGTALLWDVEKGQTARTVASSGEAFYAGSFSPDGKRVAAALGGSGVRIWDVAGTQDPVDLDIPGGNAYSAVFSRDGSLLAFGSDTSAVGVLDTRSWKQTHEFSGARGDEKINSVAFSPDGGKLLGSNAYGTAYLWHIGGGATGQSLSGNINGDGLAYSPDGRWVAFTGTRNAALWDTRAGGSPTDMQTGGKQVVGVAFSPDGKKLALAQYDAPVVVVPVPAS